MSWIFIEAEDVWFFRDTRAFGRGEEHLAHCTFPPFPATVAGALRSRVISSYPNWDQARFNQGMDPTLYARIGKVDDLGPNFRIRGPFLAAQTAGQVACYCPMPADCYLEDASLLRFGSYKPAHIPGLKANFPGNELFPLWPPAGERKDAVEGSYWLSQSGFRFYQSGGPFSAREENNFFVYEHRSGIGRDPFTRTAKDKMLYTISLVSLQQNTGLLLWVNDAVQLPPSGMLSLGGEGRAARYKTIPEDQVHPMPMVCTVGKTRVKLVLLTPAYFKHNFKRDWRPSDSDWSVFGLPAGAKLRAVAVGRPQLVNGWDIANNSAKPLRWFVPAGSVFYFEWDQPLLVDLKPEQICFTESPDLTANYPGLGMGQIALALWDWES